MKIVEIIRCQSERGKWLGKCYICTYVRMYIVFHRNSSQHQHPCASIKIDKTLAKSPWIIKTKLWKYKEMLAIKLYSTKSGASLGKRCAATYRKYLWTRVQWPQVRKLHSRFFLINEKQIGKRQLSCFSAWKCEMLFVRLCSFFFYFLFMPHAGGKRPSVPRAGQKLNFQSESPRKSKAKLCARSGKSVSYEFNSLLFFCGWSLASHQIHAVSQIWQLWVTGELTLSPWHFESPFRRDLD